MADYFNLDSTKSVESSTGVWYRCIQRLGIGGNAVTFLVLCSDGDNRGALFAMKVFRRLSAPDRQKKFLQETRLLSELNHPCILRVYDEGVFRAPGGRYPFVIAEYLPNTLQELLRRGIPFVEKLVFSLQLLSALSYLAKHRPAILHRDIKPANIFIKGRSCVLGDFGLMKLLNRDVEVDRDILKESLGPGIPFYYRTPDLVAYARDGAALTPKTDVFQLGLTLTHLFTGRNPCRRSDDPLAPVALEPIEQIPGKWGDAIRALLNKMLEFGVHSRPSAENLFQRWQEVFFSAVLHQQQLDGQAFR